MITPSTETLDIGLNDCSWKSLSREAAESLLRTCSYPSAEERTYTSVQILSTPCGQDLYVRASISG